MPLLRSGTSTVTYCACPACGSNCVRAARRFIQFVNLFPDHSGGDVPWPVYVCLDCPTFGRPTCVFTETAWESVQADRAEERGDICRIIRGPGEWYITCDDVFAYLSYLWLCIEDGAAVRRRPQLQGAVGPCPLPYISEHTPESLRNPPIEQESVWSSLEAQGYYVADLRPSTSE
jgi:hypothetical protein